MWLPETKVDERVMIIPGTDGQKMSKSYDNFIDIFLPDKRVKETNYGYSNRLYVIRRSERYQNCNVFKIYKLLATEATNL